MLFPPPFPLHAASKVPAPTNTKANLVFIEQSPFQSSLDEYGAIVNSSSFGLLPYRPR
jgi:hypothetical protein